MKKLVAWVVALSMLFCCAGALAEDNSLTAIQEKGTFILGLDDAFPPMGFRDEANEIVGFDIDLAKEVCARLGVELVLQPVDWSAKELELSTGNIDCIWNGMSITPEREESMAMSEAYLNNKIVLAVKKSDGYASKEDLVGKKVGVQSGSFAEEVLEQYESYQEYYASLDEVLGYADYLTALMDLQNGNIDAVLIDLVVAEYTLKNLGDENLTIIDNLEDDRFGIGFRKEDVALRDAVNATLKEMKADGKLAEISGTWFGADITTIE